MLASVSLLTFKTILELPIALEWKPYSQSEVKVVIATQYHCCYLNKLVTILAINTYLRDRYVEMVYLLGKNQGTT